MQLYLKTTYNSKPGETVFVEILNVENLLSNTFNLNYKDDNIWEGNISIEKKNVNKKISYKIYVIQEDNPLDKKMLYQDKIKLKNKKYTSIRILNVEHSETKTIDLTGSKPFKKVFNNVNSPQKKAAKKRITHVFKITHPILQDHIFLCLTGSANKLNLFNAEEPVLFSKEKNGSSILQFNFSKEIFPIEYKIAFYDVEKKYIVSYESGPNKIIENEGEHAQLTVIHSAPDCENYLWKGAGINLPVFSIRTNNTWGSGDFSSIKMLVDYAASVGIKMIQLLPVNDTIATYSEKDSYPYSAISSFALNPLYLNLNSILNQYNIALSKEEEVEILRLNACTTCDFTAVVNLKLSVIKRVTEVVNTDFLKDKQWQIFYENAYEWLVPYAAFCILRDKYKTVNTRSWPEFELYSNDQILALVHPSSADYSTVLYWYFIQYNLHLQLKEASKYANKYKIILKADLPIGIAKDSVDAWVNPEQFHMNMQAGAPPDAFSMVGQNWGFPTYNIQKMREDGFAWFIKRMKSLEHYFDALRIDHVLGLFRIWSVPQNQVDGSMGIFVPVVPLSQSDFTNAGINFNEEKFCNPFITDDLLAETFAEDAEAIKVIFFNDNFLKNEFNNQQKITAYFENKSEFIKYESRLFKMVSNVILLKDASRIDAYHFRINMQQTFSYQQLQETDKKILDRLYNKYFFEIQNDLWQKEGTETLSMLAESTKMLLCAEDLGMVPPFTEQVLSDLNILSLQIQQMPKTGNEIFSDTRFAKYPCVVMPATHDMAPIRLWWEQNKAQVQIFYNTILNEDGPAPYFCEPWVCKKIIELHLQSPAMWCVFLLQDLMSVDGKIRRPIPAEERINDPANPNQVWNYRMHLTIEELMQAEKLNLQIKKMIKDTGR